jgi:hypothetical protein
VSFVAPKADAAGTIHLLVAVTDNAVPSLIRCGRVIVTIDPTATAVNDKESSKMASQTGKSKLE